MRGKRVEWNTPIFLDSNELAFLGAPKLTEQQKLVLKSTNILSAFSNFNYDRAALGLVALESQKR